MQLVSIPGNMRLEVNETDTAYITPVTITPTGMEMVRNRNDTWAFNSQGFLRTHRTTRKAFFVPDSRCPIPTDRLENYRRTTVHTEWQQRRLRRQVPRPQQVTTKESPTRTNLDRRNMVQSEERNTSPWQHTTTTKSIAFSGNTFARNSKRINISSRATTTTDKRHSQEND